MAFAVHPFPVRKLPPLLKTVQQYWSGLIRAENEMPFADDVNLSRLPDAADHVILLDVFAGPQRFRFNELGRGVMDRVRISIKGKFIDEMEPIAPFNFLIAQASATVEARAPTLYAVGSLGKKLAPADSYSRLLLPTWGNGRIELLLGAIV